MVVLPNITVEYQTWGAKLAPSLENFFLLITVSCFIP